MNDMVNTYQKHWEREIKQILIFLVIVTIEEYIFPSYYKVKPVKKFQHNYKSIYFSLRSLIYSKSQTIKKTVIILNCYTPKYLLSNNSQYQNDNIINIF